MESNKMPFVLITAGPTREAIDPVRFISNHSSGKMGYAIAGSFLKRGFDVILISGPVNLSLAHRNLVTIKVNSADEMFEAAKLFFSRLDIAVFAAAVADYRPEIILDQKMKKSSDRFNLDMVKNVDIASEFGKIKTAGQVSVGFALETNDEESNALQKLNTKGFDMIVLNSLCDQSAAFGFDTNKITIITRDSPLERFPLKDKKEVAEDIVSRTIGLKTQQHSTIYHNDIQTV